MVDTFSANTNMDARAYRSNHITNYNLYNKNKAEYYKLYGKIKVLKKFIKI